MASSDVPATACPGCGRRNDAATSVFSDSKPSPGSVSVCIACGHISVFNADLTLRNPTDAETREIAGDRRILAVQRARDQLMQELRDRAYVEDFVRETIKKHGPLSTHERINEIVDVTLARIPQRPRKRR